MKLIVLIVVSITVFIANCRERPDSREISDDVNSLSDDQNFFDDRDLSDSHNLSAGLDLSDDHDLSAGIDLPYGSDLSDGANNDISTTEPVSFSGDPMDLLSSLVDRQLKEEGRVRNKRNLRGGSKCKSDIVCSLLGGSCVTNSTYCSGREVPSVCSGAKCKCCINVNLEVKVHDLETELRAMVVNLTSANSNLNTKLDSIMSTNSNLTIANSNMDLKMDSIISTNSNLTIANSEIQNMLDSIKDNLTNANANQDLKLDTIMEHQGCPEGLFLFPPSNQCFRILTDTVRSWDNAKSACRALGLELAQPFDPIGLRSYLVTKYGIADETWLDARGDGRNIRWKRNGRAAISSNSPFWWPGRPGSDVSTNTCLYMLNSEGWMKQNPGHPYYNSGCSRSELSLCELVIE